MTTCLHRPRSNTDELGEDVSPHPLPLTPAIQSNPYRTCSNLKDKFHVSSRLRFLKHHLLPHVQGERLVRHLREKRLVVQPTADVKPRPLRSGAKSKPAVATSAATAEPIETTVWLWRATRPPKPKQKAPVPRPPIVYDYSHMKASKRKAHKARDELNAKRAMLRGRREKLEGDAKRKAERERQAVLKAEGRIRHQQAEEASRIEKERKRKEWEEKNPILARTLTKQREKAATLGKAPLAPGQLPTPSPRLHA
ncbi:hypothetical protein B0H10DRAFT_925130 [Mycena sp. CBHHK59/15]|nr:hypothetical protein B0H10DRAFT_925130 [Mycena sp. CBHHK59/15]